MVNVVKTNTENKQLFMLLCKLLICLANHNDGQDIWNTVKKSWKIGREQKTLRTASA